MVGKHRSIGAHHEAGHAVIARKLGIEIEYVSVRPTSEQNSGNVRAHSAAWLARDLDVPAQIAAFEKDIKVALAGRVANKRSHPNMMFVGEEFEIDAENVAKRVSCVAVLMAGLPLDERLSDVMTDAIAEHASSIVDRLEQETAALVDRHWLAIKRVAKELETRDRIDQAKLDELIASAERRANVAR